VRRTTLIRALVSIIVLTVVGYTAYVFFLIDDEKAPPPRTAAVTEANNGGEVTVPLNQPFVVNLKGSPAAPWGLPRSEADSLALTRSAEELDGSATATFVPQKVAPAIVVRAERGGTSPETFTVTIRVVG